MIKIVTLLSLTFLLSCSKEYASYKRDTGNGRVTIMPKNAKIYKAKVIKWKVGAAFKQQVSKGFLVELKFPQLEKDDFKDLIKNRKINSWLVEITRETAVKNERLGYMYIPLYSATKRAKKIYNHRQTKGGYIRLLYHAATPSNRFESFQCPAFGHDYVIDDLTLVKKKRPLSKIVISSAYDRVISKRVEEFSLAPVGISGGITLKGRYIIKIALYDSVNKITRSSFLTLNDEIIVKKERHKTISGCAGFVIPPKPPETKKKFRWNR